MATKQIKYSKENMRPNNMKYVSNGVSGIIIEEYS